MRKLKVRLGNENKEEDLKQRNRGDQRLKNQTKLQEQMAEKMSHE